jgi:hypothetical protein
MALNSCKGDMESGNVLFYESHAAARSLKNSWTRMASTYGCIMVSLSKETLIIRPHWFAGWLMHLLGLDLYHEIPVSKIRGVAASGKWFSRGEVVLHFIFDGEERNVVLYLKKYHEFIEKVKAASPENESAALL